MANHIQLGGVESHLHQLGVPTPIPPFENAEVLTNPIDICCRYLADFLTHLVQDVKPEVIHDSIQWTNALSHGDLVVVVPKLRLKGVKPFDVAKDFCSIVSCPVPCEVWGH